MCCPPVKERVLFMCGIVGYTGKRNASNVLIDGLRKLEYSGYDSAGIAVFENDGIKVVKAKGRLNDLEKNEPSGSRKDAAGSDTPAGRPMESRRTSIPIRMEARRSRLYTTGLLKIIWN